MTDLQSEVRAPLVRAPIAWVARRLLSTDASVQAVMVLGPGGKILAHERAVGYDEPLHASGSERSLIYYAPGPGLLFYLHTSSEPVESELFAKIEAIVGSPSPAVTR